MTFSDEPRASQDLRWYRGPEGWGVWALFGFTVAAILGYAVFGLHPERVPNALLGFWRISFNFFAQVHILLGAAALFLVLVVRSGARWVPALVAVYLVSFLSEFWGTGYGFPFGRYEYTHLLGSKLGGRVPWVIPLSWFLMAVPSWVLARATFPAPERWVARVSFAAVLLTLWDLALDPAMSYQMPFYWRWESTGPYYGMPWVNLAGWLGTGVVIMAALELLRAREWGRGLSVSWAAAYYGVTLLMPVGMLLVEGLWLALAVTGVALLLAWLFHLRMVGGRTAAKGSPPDAASRHHPAARESM